MKKQATIEDCEKIVLRLGILPGWKMRVYVVPETGYFEVRYTKGKYSGAVIIKREWVEDKKLTEIDPLLKQLAGSAERMYHKVDEKLKEQNTEGEAVEQRGPDPGLHAAGQEAQQEDVGQAVAEGCGNDGCKENNND